MLLEKVRQIIGQPESQTLEYKVSVPPRKAIERIIASFANTAGGLLIFGVKDNLDIQGLDEDTVVSRIVDSAITHLQPQPTVAHEFIDLEGKRLYVVDVETSDSPVVSDDGVIYGRRGAQTIKMSATDVFVRPPLETSHKSSFTKLEEIAEKIVTAKSGATEAKNIFLDQYSNLIDLIIHSSTLLYPISPVELSSHPAGIALSRLLLSSFVDTFEKYLSDLLYEIFLAEPQTLKSDSPVTVKEVLSCKDMDEFIRVVAQKKVGDLSKGNAKDSINKNKPIKDLGIFSDAIIDQIEGFFQIRHLYTHRNGQVDAKFITKTKGSWKVGDIHQLSITDLCAIAEFLIDIVDQLDQASIAKYSLSSSTP